MHKGVPYGSHQLKYSSPNRSLKQNKKQEPHIKEPTFQKTEIYGGKGQDNGPKSEKDQRERATGLGRKTRDEI